MITEPKLSGRWTLRSPQNATNPTKEAENHLQRRSGSPVRAHVRASTSTAVERCTSQASDELSGKTQAARGRHTHGSTFPPWQQSTGRNQGPSKTHSPHSETGLASEHPNKAVANVSARGGSISPLLGRQNHDSSAGGSGNKHLEEGDSTSVAVDERLSSRSSKTHANVRHPCDDYNAFSNLKGAVDTGLDDSLWQDINFKDVFEQAECHPSTSSSTDRGEKRTPSYPKEMSGRESEKVMGNREERGQWNRAGPRLFSDAPRLPHIAFIGIFLNGIGVTLASFAPVAGAEGKALVRSLLLEPHTPILPGSCYASHGSPVAVHMAVDCNNRVYACVTTGDVSRSVAFSLLEEVRSQHISKVEFMAFTIKRNSHQKRCHAQLARTWAKYEEMGRSIAVKKEIRRRLGEEQVNIEPVCSSAGGPRAEGEGDKIRETTLIQEEVGVLLLDFSTAHETAAALALRKILSRRESSCDGDDARCSPPEDGGLRRSLKITLVAVVASAVIIAVSWAARVVYFSG